MSSPKAGFRCLPNVTYCCISDDQDNNEETKQTFPSSRYTQASLRQMLQAMGCKPRHATKACAKVFLILQQRAALPPSEHYSLALSLRLPRPEVGFVTLPRLEFERLVLEALQSHDPAHSLIDLRTAAALHERHASVTILLCGTSGTGKSTLASLLAARLGITTIVSTDSIRHLMRSFVDPREQPLLWASTYEAGAALALTDTHQASSTNNQCPAPDPRRAAVQGYLAQAEAVMAHVDKLIAAAEARRDSVVIEGVHLSPLFAAQLMLQRPSVVPFLVHISNEAKHMERFAVRAKAMTLRPDGNRYVRHLRTIRDIQDHLCAAADRRAVPKVDNTNVDRSVATIHATVLGCLRKKASGEALIDPGTGRCTAVLEEYLGCKSATWSGSDMLELIRRKIAAGEAVSPTEGPSTSAASTSVAGASTPKGPLSEIGGGGNSGQMSRGGDGVSMLGAAAAVNSNSAAAVSMQVTRNGDQRSFYGSACQSSNGGDEQGDRYSEEMELRGDESESEVESQSGGGARGSPSGMRAGRRSNGFREGDEGESIEVGSVLETDEGRSEAGETGIG